MQKKYGPKGFTLVALSYEKASLVMPYVKKKKMSYIVGGDAKATKDAYGVKAWPDYFVIDPNGKIVYRGIDSHKVEEAVKKVLKDTPPTSTGPLAKASPAAAYKRATKLYKSKKYLQAIEAYEKLVRDSPAAKYATKAKAKLEKIRANKKIMAKVRHAEEQKKCESWLERARASAKDGKKSEATKHYKKIIKEFPDTPYADTARREMADL
jgi:TolA-binding protein